MTQSKDKVRELVVSPKVCPRCNNNDFYETNHNQYHCRGCFYEWDNQRIKEGRIA